MQEKHSERQRGYLNVPKQKLQHKHDTSLLFCSRISLVRVIAICIFTMTCQCDARPKKTQYISNSTPFEYIHIGKTGGGTIKRELIRAGFNFRTVHIGFFLRGHSKINFKSGKNYVISIRNPICRWVSAFNWRYYLIVDTEKRKGERGENKFLRYWKTPNNLAEHLYDELGNRNFKHDIPGTHVEMGIYYYLKGLSNDTKILGVIMQETLAEDMKRLFNITTSARSHGSYGEYSKYLSSKSIDNLRKYLKEDYRCLKQLEDMQLLSPNQIRAYKNDYEC